MHCYYCCRPAALATGKVQQPTGLRPAGQVIEQAPSGRGEHKSPEASALLLHLPLAVEGLCLMTVGFGPLALTALTQLQGGTRHPFGNVIMSDLVSMSVS